jgi:DNA polymerase III psi subunit
VSVYDLRPDELSTLEDACRLTDMIDAMSKVWADEGRPLTTQGSMGQLVTHPMVSEIRTHRMARNALWRQLRLPDAGNQEAGATNQHRAAAQSRWAAAHGNGA